jgi:hypothetical protein
MQMMFVLHRRHTYDPLLPVTGIALLVYMQKMFVLHRRHTYGPLLPVTGIALLVYMQMMFVLHRRHTYRPLLPVYLLLYRYVRNIRACSGYWAADRTAAGRYQQSRTRAVMAYSCVSLDRSELHVGSLLPLLLPSRGNEKRDERMLMNREESK